MEIIDKMLLPLSVLRLIGKIGQGSIPWTLVGSVALIFVLLRYLSIRLASISTVDKNQGVPMGQTLIARTRIFFSSLTETAWATSVGCVAGHLST